MTREDVMSTVWSIFQSLVVTPGHAPTPSQPFAWSSRRFKLWSDVLPENKPSLLMTEPRQNDERPDLSEPNTITIYAFLWIYTDAGTDQAVYPVIVMNNLISAVRAKLKPDPFTGRCTLGGLITDVSVIGDTMSDPGDLDGNGVTKIPLRIIVPAF